MKQLISISVIFFFVATAGPRTERSNAASFCSTIGDSITDNYAFFQHYINENAGSIIYLKPGNFYISNTLHIPANTSIIGNHSALFNGTSDTLLIINGSRVKIDGLELQGVGNDKISFSNIGIYHSRLTEDSDIIIQNCYIHDLGYKGIYLFNVKDSKIVNCKIERVGYTGIGISSATNCNTTYCSVRDVIPNSINNAYGITYSLATHPKDSTFYPPSKNCIIQNNTVSNIPTWHGIDLHSGNNIKILDNHVDSCKVGIYVTAFAWYPQNTTVAVTVLSNPSNIIVERNTVNARSLGNGIDIFGSNANNLANNNKVIDNTIVNAGIPGNHLGGGIVFYSTKNLIISGNRVTNSITSGINAAFSNNNFIISNNLIKNVFGTSTTAGINISDSGNIGNIRDNTITSDSTGLEHSNEYGIRIVKLNKVSLQVANNHIANFTKLFSQ